MKRILVPTDFSDTAAGAFRYAQRLASQLGASLTVVHVYHPSYDLSNPYLDVPVQDFNELKQGMLDDFLRNHRLPEEKAGIYPRLVVGFAGEEIARLAGEADLVVMGTTGENDLLEKWFGSVSSYVAAQARCPVLLIPKQTVFRPLRRVMYTSNYKSADEAMLRRAVEESGFSPETVHFVHADREDNDSCYQVAELRYKQLLEAGQPALDLRFVQITCTDILEGLLQYAEEHEIDLLMMGTVHRNFLERLFHRSVTRQMILRTRLPLLILHFDD